ncbi:MAG: DUF6428 family protein [Aureispira sp.]
MELSAVKAALNSLSEIAFQLPDGNLVPRHFHVTEVGKVSKHFIDCGGKIRQEEKISFQLWNAQDYDHRLHPEKLLKIIELSEQTLGLGNEEIEVEYQGPDTIAKFALDFDGKNFLLVATQTDCLAKEACNIPAQKPKVNLANLIVGNACDPKSGCC